VGGARLTMHRLLRRQLETHLGPDRETGPELRRLLRDIDARYRRADEDEASLRTALELVSDLTRRLAGAGARGREACDPAPGGLLRRLFAQAPFAVVFVDDELRVRAWSPGSERLLGYRAGEALERDVTALLFTAEDRDDARRDLRAILERGAAHESLRRMATRDGATRQHTWTVVPLRGEVGRPAGAAVLVRAPPEASDRYEVAAQGTGDVLWDWDLRDDRLWLSDAWGDLVGGRASGAASEWLSRVHESDRGAVDEALREHREGRTARFELEHRLRTETGALRWVLARGRALRDAGGKALRMTGSMTDITARREAIEHLLHDALHDPLTRLPNRALFLDLVKRSFARSRRRGDYRFAVVFLDLDRFKAVNDELGHAAGDELLVQMAARLQTCLREGDTLARLGGDEFTILLDDVRDASDTHIVADRIRQVSTEPFRLAGHDVTVSASLGIALSAPSYGRPEDLLHDADSAMYRAKAQGRARSVVFDPGMRERAPELLALEAELRRALLRKEFRVHYLPIVETASGRIQGLEALIRWEHPTRGVVAPEHFVPVAEETGLIVPIGRWLLHEAVRDFQGWRRATPDGALTLHVNLSSKQLLHSDLLETIDGALHEHRLGAHELAVELTEQTMQQGADAGQRIAQLRERGVRLCMDDFGTGPSSMSALCRAQLDSLKIDRSLFSGGSPRGQAPDLVRTILAVARSLGKSVVAEGIETAEQLGFLRELGCTAAQGFYFSPPIDIQGARSLLDRGASWYLPPDGPPAVRHIAPQAQA
jgi:diguanylate cyclase (GGDEF)-like protein/PAS domain S-box-containing protein